MERTYSTWTYLLGLPSVQDFLTFMRLKASLNTQESESDWMSQWEAVAEHRGILQEEARNAEVSVLAPLPQEVYERSIGELQNPLIRQAFAGLPYRWAAVDIEKLIPNQKVINEEFVATVDSSVARDLGQDALFDIALGQSNSQARVDVTRLSDTAYSFTSPSTDVRPLGAKLLDTAALADLGGLGFKGYVTNVLCIAVGFGVNCVSAVHFRNRLILANGTHRICRWYLEGIRIVPCLVRSVALDRHLDLIGDQDLRQSCQLYTQQSRPPLIRDFFDPKLVKKVTAPRENRVVHVQFGTQSSRSAAG